MELGEGFSSVAGGGALEPPRGPPPSYEEAIGGTAPRSEWSPLVPIDEEPPPDYHPGTPPPYSSSLSLSRHAAPGSLLFPVSVAPPRLGVQSYGGRSLWDPEDPEGTDSEETLDAVRALGGGFGASRFGGSGVTLASLEGEVRRWAFWTLGTALLLLLIFLLIVIGVVIGTQQHKNPGSGDT